MAVSEASAVQLSGATGIRRQEQSSNFAIESTWPIIGIMRLLVVLASTSLNRATSKIWM